MYNEETQEELIDGEFYSEEEKHRVLIYRAINTIDVKFHEDYNNGKITLQALNTIRYYCRDLRAYNLLAEIDMSKK